jgi:hypothetical protein
VQKTWVNGPSLPSARDFIGVAAAGNAVFVIGGSAGENASVGDVDRCDMRR